MKDDPLSLGALVTTHKLDLFAACRDMFDVIGPHAKLMAETSCLSKRDGKLICTAKDPITSGLSLDGFLPAGPLRRDRRRGVLHGRRRLDHRAHLAPDAAGRDADRAEPHRRLQPVAAAPRSHPQHPRAARHRHALRIRAGAARRGQRRGDGRPQAGFAGDQRHRPRQRRARFAADRRRRLPRARHRLGSQLSRRPRLPRPGAGASRKPGSCRSRTAGPISSTAGRRSSPRSSTSRSGTYGRAFRRHPPHRGRSDRAGR